MGMGGPSPSDIREKLKSEKDDNGLVQQMKSGCRAPPIRGRVPGGKSFRTRKTFADEEGDVGPYPIYLAGARVG